MKKALFMLFGVVLGGALFSTPAQAAGQIEVNTYYDIPDGDFRNLSVTGNTQLGSSGGNIILNTGGGFTGIGVAGAGPERLVVAGSLNGLTTAALMDNGANGVNLGGNGGAFGVVQARSGGAETNLRLNPNGGAVNVGGTYGGCANCLQVNGTLGVTQGGQTGEVKVTYVNSGGVSGYYATYAA